MHLIAIKGYCLLLQKYLYLPHGGFLSLIPPTPPEIPDKLYSFYFSVKIWAFEIPHPIAISNDHQWVRYGCFLEAHHYTLVVRRPVTAHRGIYAKELYRQSDFTTWMQRSVYITLEFKNLNGPITSWAGLVS